MSMTNYRGGRDRDSDDMFQVVLCVEDRWRVRGLDVECVKEVGGSKR